MLSRLASLAVHRRRLVLTLSALGFLLIAVVSGPVMTSLSAGGFDDPDSESAAASDILEDRFDAGDANFILLVTPDKALDDPQTRRDGERLTKKLAAQDGVESVDSYFAGQGGQPPEELVSEKGDQALIVARLVGDDDKQAETAEEIVPEVTGDQGSLAVKSGGYAEFNRQANEKVEKDLLLAESIAVPITLLLLILVFRSGAAALLPLAVAGVSVVGSLAALVVIAQFTSVSVFATNLTTALGLGLAIDYSLFIVSRYREELAKGCDLEEALRRSLNTAGRTVFFSSLTVLLSLCALLVFPLFYLTSFAYAGIGVVIFAMLGSLVVLPALLSLLGPRIDRYDLLAVFRRGRPRPEGPRSDGFWYRLATFVMRRPVPVLTVVLIGLAVIVAPFGSASYGLPDDRSLSKDAEAAQVGDALREDFPALAGQGLQIVLDGAKPSSGDLTAYATEVSRVDGIERVDSSAGVFQDGERVADAPPGAPDVFDADDATWLSLQSVTEAYSDDGQDMVADVRGVSPPDGAESKVGGMAAAYTDTLDGLWDALPYAVLIIAVLTFVLLFLFTGSLLVPAKAIIMNLLSLTATFGAMVFIFQEGHLTFLAGDFTVTGQIDVTMPILMFCVIFGLSMDYEVFLLSRIKEEYDRTGDNTLAVAHGIQSTGRLITAAAGLMAIFFVALVFTSFTPVKILGLGTALAIVMDALIIRGLLVPAFMRLAGRANWWAPGPLRRFHQKYGFHHEVPAAPAADGPAAVPAQATEEGVPKRTGAAR
ncbi:MMPL family transporter [Streptomyces alfalfae]|uniref:MMPL family transporter n=1 Tax=Streptomyces alfalfae TaxID=1642299 RepID=A0A7T4PG63_9ACTN|nr:MMPL family transporter [Streptomyces alfalfae]QQC89678.1 MMPL family transporter [Streptomyces alfalfae]